LKQQPGFGGSSVLPSEGDNGDGRALLIGVPDGVIPDLRRQGIPFVVHMHTYHTRMTVEGDDLPSGRYGTVEAITKRFGDGVRIIDATPVEVEPENFCPYWDGFARQGHPPAAK
jgi:hypothetical protein